VVLGVYGWEMQSKDLAISQAMVDQGVPPRFLLWLAGREGQMGKHVAQESTSSGAQHVAASVQRRSAPFTAGPLAVGFLLGWQPGHRQRTS
jgi:hypothetical protein